MNREMINDLNEIMIKLEALALYLLLEDIPVAKTFRKAHKSCSELYDQVEKHELSKK